ncbi:MAG: ARMT1-like domain-containing protein [Methanomicrobiaceae archaeon]|nr:ARMT1-like domain-containing protein [Methanomicrobiaceae archaeon]
MRITDRCVDCLLSRVEYECRLAGADTARCARTVDACASLLAEIAGEAVPAPVIASRIHRLAYRLIGNPDPYKELKEENMKVALRCARRVQGSLSGFRDLVLASVIANTLDYGSLEHQVTDDFEGFFQDAFSADLAIDHTPAMRPRLERVVYLCDNCGEIVFDAMLLRHLVSAGSHLTVVVKGAPILNDATCREAGLLGLHQIADAVVTNAGPVAELGVNCALAPEELIHAIRRSTLVIAKGMANYESLSEERLGVPVAYLLSAKCVPIARSIGVSVGSMVAYMPGQG